MSQNAPRFRGAFQVAFAAVGGEVSADRAGRTRNRFPLPSAVARRFRRGRFPSAPSAEIVVRAGLDGARSDDEVFDAQILGAGGVQSVDGQVVVGLEVVNPITDLRLLADHEVDEALKAH